MNLVQAAEHDSAPFQMFRNAPFHVFERQALSLRFEVSSKIPVLTKHVAPPAKALVRQLAAFIRNEFVVPSLKSKSRREYLQFWAEKLREFDETVRAFHVLIKRSFRRSSLDTVAEKAWVTTRRKIEDVLAGVASNAADEFDFCFSTAERTNRLIAKFGDTAPSDAERDSELLAKYQNASALFTVGLFSVIELAGGAKTRSAEIVDEALAFLRQGALHAYAAAREAYSLRRQDDDAVTPAQEVTSAESDELALAELLIEDVADIAEACGAKLLTRQ